MVHPWSGDDAGSDTSSVGGNSLGLESSIWSVVILSRLEFMEEFRIRAAERRRERRLVPINSIIDGCVANLRMNVSCQHKLT